MIPIGTFIPSQFLAPANPLTLYGVDQHFQYIRIINNSPYQQSVNQAGQRTTIPEFYTQDVAVWEGFQGTLIITPSINITTVSHGQSNTLILEGYYKGEIDSPVSQAIPQQSVTTTASGKPLFTASVGFGSTVGLAQYLNIFNPPNSGVNMTFHSARAFTNDSTFPTTDLYIIPGGDKNLATAVPAVSHDAKTSPPVSFAHATALDQTIDETGGNTGLIETMDMQAGVTQDMLAFPDQVILYPGNNLLFALFSGGTAKIVRMTMKWSEDIAVPPQGGLLTGIVMTSIQNVGNAAPTPVITASPLSENTATLINNDGTETLGSNTRTPAIKFSDPSSSAQPVLASDGTGTVNLAALLAAKQIGLFVGATKVGHIDNGGLHLEAGAFQFDGSASTLTTGLVKLITGSFTRVSSFSGTATTVSTFFNHNLGVLPDVVLLQLNGVSSTAHSITADYATMTTTQVKLTADGNNAFVGLAIKF